MGDRVSDDKWIDDLALDVANRKVTQRAAFQVAYLKGYGAVGRADAWNNGYTAGHSIAMRRMSDEPAAPTPSNPHE